MIKLGLSLLGFLLPLTLLGVTFTSRSNSKPVAGDFDSYVLALSYQNDFCLTHEEKVECKDALTEPKITLHGLWPNQDNDPSHHYQYCALSKEETSKDWCDLTQDVKSKVSACTFKRLSEIMPGVQSCLYNHEWYAHGTCTGLTEEAYFRISSRLTNRFRSRAKQFHERLKVNFGKEVEKTALYAALLQDFGKELEQSIALRCRQKRAGGKTLQFLSEIQITLEPKSLDSFPAKESLRAQEADRDNCGPGPVLINSPELYASVNATPPAPREGEYLMKDDPTALFNPCPCAKFPGKSFCRSLGFGRLSDGTIINYKEGGIGKQVSGKTYGSVQEFIDQNVCK